MLSLAFGNIITKPLGISINRTVPYTSLKWESLNLEDVDVTLNPVNASINKIDLKNFYSRLIINPDGTLNVATIVKKDMKEETPTVETKSSDKEEEKSDKVDIQIETFSLQGGHINFSDNFVKPNYSANLLDLKGNISGLSTNEEMLADVDVRGSLGGHAPLTITGKINPLSKDIFVDLETEVKDFDLSPVTPYSGKKHWICNREGKTIFHSQIPCKK